MKRLSLVFGGNLKYFFYDIKTNLRNINFKTGEIGNDCIEMFLKNRFEIEGYVGISFNLYNIEK